MRTLVKRLKLFLRFLRQKEIKFNVGSGGVNMAKGWYCTDIDTLDITKLRHWRRLLLCLKVDNIMAEHVWEHLSEEDTDLANENCFRFLKRNGVLRIAVPDGFHPSRDYIEYVRPGGTGAGADDHKILYTYKTMKECLQKVGFHVVLLEYWDENGVFHFNDWSEKDGKIWRSRRYDKRNSGGTLNYTSLIVDAIKVV